MIRVFLVFCVISRVLSAPAEDANSLFKIVVNDNRTENLRKYPYVQECLENTKFSKTICMSLYDVAILFYNQKLELTSISATYGKGKFCEALTQILPNSPNNDTSKAFEHLAPWFKDTLTKKDGKDYCNQNCFFKDRSNYKTELLPVCQFLLNQYSFLFNQSNIIGSFEVVKSDEIIGE